MWRYTSQPEKAKNSMSDAAMLHLGQTLNTKHVPKMISMATSANRIGHTAPSNAQLKDSIVRSGLLALLNPAYSSTPPTKTGPSFKRPRTLEPHEDSAAQSPERESVGGGDVSAVLMSPPHEVMVTVPKTCSD